MHGRKRLRSNLMRRNADIELLRRIDLSALPVKFHSTEFLIELDATIEKHSPENGELTMRYEIPDRLQNGWGVVHGGILSTVLDQTMINALFLNAVVTAQPVFIGNRVAQLSAQCFDGTEDGALVATATSSTLLRRNTSDG